MKNSLNNWGGALAHRVDTLRSLGSYFTCLLGENLVRLSELLDNKKKGGEVVQDIIVNKIAPNGLGFGEGQISGESNKNGINQEVLDSAAEEILKPDYYKTVKVYESGCGDGRPVQSVWAKVKSKFNGSKHQLEASESKLRPKLFGGDFATMYSALAVATDRGRNAKTAQEMDDYAIEIFNKMGWVLGTHNDDHNSPDDLHGCGAIDKRPVIVANSIKFAEQINRIASTKFGVSVEALQQVKDVFSSRCEGEYFKGYDGAHLQGRLEKKCNNVVRKVLTGNHQEAFVVINTRRGTTFDQASFREAMGNKYPDKKLPQVFVVDIWQAEAMIDKLIEKGHIEENQKDVAMAGVITYTLATAGTLTDGTLPVFLAS